MRINPFVYGFFVLAVFLGIVQGFQAAGVWSTSGKIDSAGKRVQPSAADVNTIKGWMTLEQVTSAFGVSQEELAAQFGLPADTPASTPLKDLESETFSVSDLRLWLQVRSSPAAPQ